MNLIEIRAPQSVTEYYAACAMVERVYRDAGYVPENLPIKHPGAVILSIKNGAIVGSIGLQSGDDGYLPTERAFGFHSEEICPFPRESIFEPLRLVITDRCDTSSIKGLIAAVILHTTENCLGNQWIMTIKPTLAKVLKRYCHLRTDTLDLQVLPEAIPMHPGYWQTDPIPTAIRINREYADAALARLSIELEGRVEFNLSTFDHHLHYGYESTYTDRSIPAALAC